MPPLKMRTTTSGTAVPDGRPTTTRSWAASPDGHSRTTTTSGTAASTPPTTARASLNEFFRNKLKVE